MTFRKLLWLLCSILFFIGCSPSTGKWNEEVKKQKANKGWVPILEQFDGKRIAFLNIYSPEKIEDGIYYVKILWVNHHSIADGYPEDVFKVIEDCNKNRSAIVNANTTSREIDLSLLEWRDIEGDQLHSILCESLSKL